MADIVKFTNAFGSGLTIDFKATPATYRITRWEPAVAPLRPSALGGPAYDDVIEEMELTILNPTPSLATTIYLEPLQRLMEWADLWNAGAMVPPVLLHYKAHSSSEEVKAVVMPPAPGEPILTLPQGVVNSEATGTIDGVILRFRRRGLWLGAEQTETSSSAANPTAATLTWSANPTGVRAPYRFSVGTISRLSSASNSYFLLGQGIAIDEAENSSGGSGFSTVADASNHARGGNVLRYSPSGTSTQTRTFSGIGGLGPDYGGHLFAIFINYRHNGGSTTYRVNFSGLAGSPPTRDTLFSSGSSAPRWIYAGTLATQSANLPTLRMNITASAGSGSIDFDSVAVLGLSSPDARVIQIGTITDTTQGTLEIRHNFLTHTTPSVFISAGGYPPYSGNIYLDTPFSKIRGAWLATEGNYWRAMNLTNTAPLNVTYSAVRQKGYTVP